jgi:hypothetical protein
MVKAAIGMEVVFFLRALYTPKRPETQKNDVFGQRTGRKNGDLEVGFFVFALNLICNGRRLREIRGRASYVGRYLHT